LEAKNFYVDYSIQLFHCENELIRRSIRIPAKPALINYVSGDSVVSVEPPSEKQVFLRSSNPDVICSVSPLVKTIFTIERFEL
jgi:hypothetical protein